MSRTTWESLAGSELASCAGSSATAVSLEGREGSRTAGQDGQNGQDRIADWLLVRLILPVRYFPAPLSPQGFFLRVRATTAGGDYEP
jgi:hypothetical protein